jgi:hypothetical protein
VRRDAAHDQPERAEQLNKLERDCRLVYTAIDKMLAEDARARTINGRATRRGLLAFVLSLLGPLMLLAFFAHRSGLAAAVPAHLAIPEEVLQIWGQTCDALVAPEPGAVASGRGAQSGVSSSSGGGGGSDGSADAPVAAAPSPEGMLTLFQLLLGTLCYLETNLLRLRARFGLPILQLLTLILHYQRLVLASRTTL